MNFILTKTSFFCILPIYVLLNETQKKATFYNQIRCFDSRPPKNIWIKIKKPFSRISETINYQPIESIAVKKVATINPQKNVFHLQPKT